MDCRRRQSGGDASAIDGSPVALGGSGGLDFAGMLRHAREVGGPALRKLTFHDRARMLKALGLAIMARKDELYELNYLTGATRKDGWIDIEGGAGTLFSFSSKGRRELPDAHVLLDGQVEGLSKKGTFVGQHIYTPLQGAAVHINAFNFPVWGMLEKLAPTILAGVPAIVKPASATAYLAEAAFRVMIEADILPRGSIQLIVGQVGDLFDHLTGQDIVSFTGSASTALKLRTHPTVIRESVRFVAEQDSLNASVLGPDAAPGTPEFDLFVKEVATEMTVKAGQKCTAIRRAMAPAEHLDAVQQALAERLAKTKVGDPRAEDTRMGALVSMSQREDVRQRIAELEAAGARIVSGDPNAQPPIPGGAFLPPVLLRTDDPWGTKPCMMWSPSGRCRRSCPIRTWTMRSLWRIAGAEASCCRSSLILPMRLESSSRAPPPITGGCWSSTAPMRRSRPATARHSRCWSTAGRGEPAAARRWAACAG